MRLLSGKNARAVVLLGVALAAAYYISTLLVGAGANSPFSSSPYTASFETNDVDDLVSFADVQMAGVPVGKVQKITNAPGKATVSFTLNPGTAPLHAGMTVRVGAKSVVGESYIDVKDGTGPQVPSGYKIPPKAVQPSVQLRDVLASLDPKTRASLGGLSQSLGESTQGTRGDVSKTMTGLGELGGNGYTALDALGSQSQDLTTVSRDTTKLLAGLDAGEGEIGRLVQNAQRLTSATAGQKQSLENTMVRLPQTLSNAQTASQKLGQLGTALTPVAGDLRSAAPDLDSALQQLPPTSKTLRELLPSLNGTLTEAPATLNRVPAVSDDVRATAPQLRTTMSNLNPMLAFLKPYGHDVAGFINNFGNVLTYKDEAGVHFTRLIASEGNEQVPKGTPLKIPNLLTYQNAYPDPMGALHPGPGGHFPKLYPEPK